MPDEDYSDDRSRLRTLLVPYYSDFESGGLLMNFLRICVLLTYFYVFFWIVVFLTPPTRKLPGFFNGLLLVWIIAGAGAVVFALTRGSPPPHNTSSGTDEPGESNE